MVYHISHAVQEKLGARGAYVENTKARMSPYLLSVFPHFCIMVSKDIARRATSKTRFVTIGWESRYKSC